MAIVKMKRLRLMAVRSQKEALLKTLIKLGCVEFSEMEGDLRESDEAALVRRESTALMTLRSQQASLNRAIELLDAYSPAKSSLLASKPEYDCDELLDDSGLAAALETAAAVISSDDRIKRIGAEQSRLRSVQEALVPWQALDMPLETEGTSRCSVILGTVPARSGLQAAEAALAAATEEAELFCVSEDKKLLYIVIVCMKDLLPAVQEAMRGTGFSAVSFGGMTGTPAEGIARTVSELHALEAEKTACTKSILALAGARDELKLSCDRAGAKISLAEAEDKLFGTDSTVIMEGWMPADCETALEETLSAFTCAWDTRDPEEDEYPKVPVSLKNNKFTNSLNMVTNMYSLPAYGTVDPNPLMAPFFILFFGLMMADMGYGLIMIAAAIVAMKKIKPRGGTQVFCQLLLYGGIATFLMGALTGGFFSDIPYQLVHLFNPDSTWEGLWHLFSPETDSNMVLYGSMVLGVLHLNTGMAVSFVQKKRAGNLAGAIWEEGSLWVILAGAILMVLGWGSIAGIPVVLVIGVIMLLFGAGRDSKGFGKVTAAFGCIYNTATGWFGDVLSYSRIMALMLAGGVIGKVFNTVALMPAKSSGVNVFTMLIFVLIFLLGHAMNFGLNILGCFVHDLRLQCLEFFGKFYTDGGKPFRPLTFRGKYVNAKEN